MSSQQPVMQVIIKATPENKEFLKTQLLNSGLQVTIEPEKKPEEPLKLSIAQNIPSTLVLLHAIETNPNSYSGEVKLADGRQFSLDENGREQIRELITTAMKQPQGAGQQPPAWTYFIPEIRAALKEIVGLIHWYPRALGKAEHQVSRNFLIVIGLSVLGVGFLTYVGKVSGDAFVFVVGILLGYLFSFLSRYLGLTGDGD